MTYIEKQTQFIRDSLFPFIGETTAKTYFSYYGIFKDGLMFGLYKAGNFYLKIASHHTTEVENHNLYPLIDKKISSTKMYYHLPPNILNNLGNYAHWILESIAEIRTIKHEIYSTKKQFIRSLPNMSLSLERILKKVDVYTIEDLIQRGEVNIFVDLIKIGIEVDSTFLFKLYGAIHRQFIYTLSSTQKTTLLQDANNALYTAGLRKRFN